MDVGTGERSEGDDVGVGSPLRRKAGQSHSLSLLKGRKRGTDPVQLAYVDGRVAARNCDLARGPGSSARVVLDRRTDAGEGVDGETGGEGGL